jgi:adenosyl cobinamide kinase/adenosyl cobinamide phosphate guanylyltransferase
VADDGAPAPLTLVLGGARSGKSAFAEALIERHPGPLLYVATGTAVDADMAARIDRHRARRGPAYETIEAGADLTGALAGAPDQPALVDALGTWVAAHVDFAVDVDALVGVLRARRAPTVVVSDEVGLGVHPSTEVGRQFRDALGTVNQAVAAVASDAWLVVAGRGLRLEAP